MVSPDDPLPLDPAVTAGTLDNGLRYFIRTNGYPENRAELRLVVNAGSVLEAEDQLGLAHLLEHMAFNGTENFEKQELVEYLESVGMAFGPEVNAYTGFDETVYMLQIPTDDPEIMATAFQILEDWAHSITLEGEEIDKERGVVIEEWRLGRGAAARIMDKQFPIVFHGSRYADRLPIGKVEVLESFPHESIRQILPRLVPTGSHGGDRSGRFQCGGDGGRDQSPILRHPRPRFPSIPNLLRCSRARGNPFCDRQRPGNHGQPGSHTLQTWNGR